MKYVSFLKLICLGFVFALLATSCVKEGPMGPAGADGSDGQDGMDGEDGNVTCLVCHSGTNMEQKQGQFAMSAHSAGAIAVDYAGAQARCAPCHSHEQFVQTMTLGSVAGNITNPSAWKCSTCHGIHKTFEGVDYALRASDPVTANFNSSVTLDMKGNSNLCAVCHQTRTAGPSITNPDSETFRITNTHWGPHHGPQANVLAGVGFEEIPGSVPYPDAGTAAHLTQASCTGCHMGDFNTGQGGHSFIPSLKACNDCHGTSLDDYNYGGKQTQVHGLLVSLRDKLIDLSVVAGSDEEGYHPVPGTYPTLYAQAYFNWIGLEEDRSQGAHNPKYVVALLMNTIEALNNYQAN
ncbi:hypothetical protein SAMN05444274_106277 [Mariniphaga anaerophila]|uniref:Uncharacterized protein n=1 Tax=Mariniphaga anaerophila TaxID=1484053 RepID=A0A1M5CUT2_9BACT|nr:hypothetical protein [Mariniphaga anaerophila]SHF58531.1 hypothetical protein SAMN05444274_106277 [Mariniphaga anaerophila]